MSISITDSSKEEANEEVPSSPSLPRNENSDNKKSHNHQRPSYGAIRTRSGTGVRATGPGTPVGRASRRLSQPSTTSGTSSPSIAATLSKASTPTGRVLTRALSTSRLSSTLTSTATAAPHMLPSHPQRSAGFNLATIGQLSPTASTSTMTMSRSETLAFLNSNSQNSYFTVGPHGASRVSYHGEMNGPSAGSGIGAGATGFGVGAATGPVTGVAGTHADGIVLPLGSSKAMPMCGSDAISLLDLEDSHNDLVMIDSNGNSSGNGVTGAAIVGETIASASAIVSNVRHSSGTLTASTTSAYLRAAGGPSGAVIPGGGSGGGIGGIGGDQGDHPASNAGGAGSGAVAALHPGNASSTLSSNLLSQGSSVPTLTSQAKKDAMQRAVMLAAMQQNGGAKILTAQRAGRWRQDLPSRKIRFGEFHRICEIEYGFEHGKVRKSVRVLSKGNWVIREISALTRFRFLHIDTVGCWGCHSH